MNPVFLVASQHLGRAKAELDKLDEAIGWFAAQPDTKSNLGRMRRALPLLRRDFHAFRDALTTDRST